MAMHITTEGVGVLLASLFSLGSLIYAADAGRRAEKANEHAETAVQTAADANILAEKSNVIAKGANELASDANGIQARFAAHATERSHVEWTAEWEQASEEMVLRNVGADTATAPSVAVYGESIHSAVAVDVDVPNGEQLRIRVDDIAPLRNLRARRNFALHQQGRQTGIVFGTTDYGAKVTVTLHWQTALGQIRTQVLEDVHVD